MTAKGFKGTTDANERQRPGGRRLDNKEKNIGHVSFFSFWPKRGEINYTIAAVAVVGRIELVAPHAIEREWRAPAAIVRM
ncbi:hypothetical protein EVAR_10523_1 [Eumeta japonica]|uniref:Uncharacterized protein n=1 Tax=Eumeta variegata TaxID=151549 RepID=A0A4C1TIR4_EUMVA|nr:hypothetical protein EVAR_10523_1 [Eumeta japonica]